MNGIEQCDLRSEPARQPFLASCLVSSRSLERGYVERGREQEFEIQATVESLVCTYEICLFFLLLLFCGR